LADEREKLWQKKSLGQVFLKTTWPAEKIVDVLISNKVRRVLEIGPGGGVLTDLLITAGMKVTAVEKDDRFARELSSNSNLEVINEDITTFNMVEWCENQNEPIAIVGNIPYNISTLILRDTLNVVDKLVCAVFMTQFEFAERLVAVPSTKKYSSLSVFAQLRSNINMECKVERDCFKPVPKVDSAIFSMMPKENVLSKSELKWVEVVCRTAFSQRRKKLHNAVKRLVAEVEGECPINYNRRPDTLSPEEYVELAGFLKQD